MDRPSERNVTVSSIIARGRVRQASLFDTTVTVTRKSGEGYTQHGDGNWHPDATSQVYQGSALVRPEAASRTEAGGEEIEIGRYLVKLPADTAVEAGDLVTVTASTHDSGLVGQTMRILDVLADEWQICRKARATTQTDVPQ